MAFRPSNDPRHVAYEILLQVADGAYSDLALDSALSRSSLDQRDKRFATELVYGLLRLRGRIDFALSQFCDQPLPKLEPDVLWLLRIGAYQLLAMDRVPSHAAVDATVELARASGQGNVTGLINAVLRTLDRRRTEIPWPQPQQLRSYMQHVCSLPVWLAKEIMRLLPNVEARALAEAFAEPPRQTLRVNTLNISREAYIAELTAAGYLAHPCSFASEGVVIERRGEQRLPGDAQGWYQIQDEASMLMAHLLDAQAGMRILDACAAPGGKTTHLAALTQNQAEIIALDKAPQRVELIKQGAKRLGCPSITAKAWDLTVAPDFIEAQSCDRILLDAPCSGIGVIRRNPEGRWNKTPVDLRQLATLQQKLLHQVAALLKPGGLLLYSVCSFSHLETDDVINHFLDQHPDFERDSLADTVPENWRQFLTDNNAVRTYPHSHQGMDAFFAVRLQKKTC